MDNATLTSTVIDAKLMCKMEWMDLNAAFFP